MTKNFRASVTAIAVNLFILSTFQSALADPITLTTTGTFSNIPTNSGCTGSGTNQLTCGGGRQITFVGNSFSGEAPGPSSITLLGTFQFVGLAASTAVGDLIPEGIRFAVFVNQLAPGPANGSFLATVIIEPSPAASFNLLRFDQNTLSIGGIEYYVLNFYFPSANLSSSTLNPVPEPTTMLLLATGLAGVARASGSVPSAD